MSANKSAGSNVPNPGEGLGRRCITGTAFLSTINGILNIITLIAILCVLISAGIAVAGDEQEADAISAEVPSASKVKLSAVATRNAVIAFAVIGLILLLADTIAHATGFLHRLPNALDLIFIVIMLVLAGIYFILACCAAAWEQKMRDTVALEDSYHRPGAAASAAFFLFVVTILVCVNFILRLVKPAPPPPQ